MKPGAQELVWEDPPVKRTWKEEFLGRLKARPGVWGRVEDGIRSSSACAWWKKQGCEAQQKQQADGTFRVWARWPAPAGLKVPKPGPAEDLVEVKVNGVATGRYVPRGTSLRPKGGAYTAESRQARGVPPEGNPL